MSSATLNGVGSALRMSPSKIIDLVSDEDDSEIDDAALDNAIRDLSRGIPQHHLNAASEALEAAFGPNENSVGEEFEEEQDEEKDDEEDDDDGDDDEEDDSIDSSFMEDTVEALTDENILDNRKFHPLSSDRQIC